jgi:recombination protein RecA
MAKASKTTGNKYNDTVAELEKKFGVGTVIRLGDKPKGDYDVISTGSFGADWIALGTGGAVQGKMYEIRGWEGSAKSTICGHLTANCQKKMYNGKPGKVMYIDSEHAVDPNYFQQLGVDLNELIFAQPNSAEEGFQIAEKLIETGQINLLIIDSDNGLIPKSLLEGEIGETSKIGKKASLNSTAYPILKVASNNNNCTIVIISQYREKIGVMFGDPKTTQGGHALKFAADVIIEMSKKLIKVADDEYAPGNEATFKTIKNKMAPPFRKATFDVIFGKGIDKIKEILEIALELELIEKSGKWIKQNGTTIASSFADLTTFAEDNPEWLKQLETDLIAKIKNKKEPVTTTVPEEQTAQKTEDNEQETVVDEVKTDTENGDNGDEGQEE